MSNLAPGWTTKQANTESVLQPENATLSHVTIGPGIGCGTLSRLVDRETDAAIQRKGQKTVDALPIL